MAEPFSILIGVFALIKTLNSSCERVLELCQKFSQIKQATMLAVQDLQDDTTKLQQTANYQEVMLRLIRQDKVPSRRLCESEIGSNTIKDLETALDSAKHLLSTGVEILESLLTSNPEDLLLSTPQALKRLLASPFRSNPTVKSLKNLTDRVKKCRKQCSTAFKELWLLYQYVQRASIQPSSHRSCLTTEGRIVSVEGSWHTYCPPLSRPRTPFTPTTDSILLDNCDDYNDAQSKRDKRSHADLSSDLQDFSSLLPSPLSSSPGFPLDHLRLSDAALSQHLISQLVASVDNLTETSNPHKRYSIIDYTHNALKTLRDDITQISNTIEEAAQVEEYKQGTWWHSDSRKTQTERLNVTLGEAKWVLEPESLSNESRHPELSTHDPFQTPTPPGGSKITLYPLGFKAHRLDRIHLELVEWLKSVHGICQEDNSRRGELIPPYKHGSQDDILEHNNSNHSTGFPFALSPANWAQISCTKLGDFNLRDTRMEEHKGWMRDAGIHWVYEQSSILLRDVPAQQNKLHPHPISLLRRFPLKSFQSSIEEYLKQPTEEEPVHDILWDHSSHVTECLTRLKESVRILIANLDEERTEFDGGMLGLVDMSTSRTHSSMTVTATSLLKEISGIVKEHERMLSAARRSEEDLQKEMIEFDSTDIAIHLYLQSWTTTVCVQGFDIYCNWLRKEVDASSTRANFAIHTYISGVLKYTQPLARPGKSPPSAARSADARKTGDCLREAVPSRQSIPLKPDNGVLTTLLHGETKAFLRVVRRMAAKARKMPARTFKNYVSSLEYILPVEMEKEILKELDDLYGRGSNPYPDRRAFESEVERAITSKLSLKLDSMSEQHTFSAPGSLKAKYYNTIVIPWSADLRDGGMKLLSKALIEGRAITEIRVKRVLERTRRKLEEDEALRNSLNERAINQLLAFCSNLWATEGALTEMENMGKTVSS